MDDIANSSPWSWHTSSIYKQVHDPHPPALLWHLPLLVEHKTVELLSMQLPAVAKKRRTHLLERTANWIRQPITSPPQSQNLRSQQQTPTIYWQRRSISGSWSITHHQAQAIKISKPLLKLQLALGNRQLLQQLTNGLTSWLGSLFSRLTLYHNSSQASRLQFGEDTSTLMPHLLFEIPDTKTSSPDEHCLPPKRPSLRIHRQPTGRPSPLIIREFGMTNEGSYCWLFSHTAHWIGY